MTSTTNRRYCEDDDCGKEIHGARSDARFCSDACRQRSYRRREASLKRYGGTWAAVFDAIVGSHASVTDRPTSSRNARLGHSVTDIVDE